jgi:hypothetical protein
MNKHERNLKAARAKIEKVLKEHDIAGFVSLHAPGHGEVFWNIWPSYSILKGDFPTIRIVSKRADYPSPHEQQEDQAATANMMMHLSTSMAGCAMQFLELSKVLDAKFESKHTEGTFKPDPGTSDPDLH